MSYGVSRWDALRVWATAILVVLCAALSWSTAHADESLSNRLDPFNGSDQPAGRPTTNTDTSTDTPAKKPKTKKGTVAEANGDAEAAALLTVAYPGPETSVTLPSPAAPVTLVLSPDSSGPAQPEAATGNAVVPAPKEPGITPTQEPVMQAPDESDAAGAVDAPKQSEVDSSSTTGKPDRKRTAKTPKPTESVEAAVQPSKKPPEAETLDPSILPDPSIADPKGSDGVEASVADEPWTAERTMALLTERALAQGSDPYEVLAVARCETGYTFMPWRDNGYLRRGSLGEVGVAQWLPPVQFNHWGRTPHWQEYQYNIEVAYLSGDPNAIWWDADALAWSMGPEAPAGFRAGWSCWRVRGPWWFVG